MDGTSVSGLSVTIKLGLSVLMCGNAMKTATPELMHMEVSKKTSLELPSLFEHDETTQAFVYNFKIHCVAFVRAMVREF